jgi:phage repressor protein C with HTH and peptisase S24 domain
MKTGDRVKLIRQELGLSQAKLAQLSGMGQSTIAELESGRNKGSVNIAKIAKALRVSPMWLTDGTGSRNIIPFESGVRATPSNGVLIEQYDTGGAMGSGIELKDQPGVISEIGVSDDWIRLNVRNYTKKENLKIVTGFGDSMAGMFNSGDPIVVDIGVKVVDRDAPYFFRVGNEGFIKLLQRVPGVGLRAISKNPEYETWTITHDMDFEILGLVIKSWSGTVHN